MEAILNSNYRSVTEVNNAMIRVYNHMFLAVLTSGVVTIGRAHV